MRVSLYLEGIFLKVKDVSFDRDDESGVLPIDR
jgi:hypothetical protein